MTILFVGCCILHLRESLSIGTQGVKIGTWYSVNYRSCSQTERRANSPRLSVPWERNGIHAVPSCIPFRSQGERLLRGIRITIRMDYAAILDFVEFRLHKIFCRALLDKNFRFLKFSTILLSARIREDLPPLRFLRPFFSDFQHFFSTCLKRSCLFCHLTFWDSPIGSWGFSFAYVYARDKGSYFFVPNWQKR